jgi:hypothetical protein
VDQDLGLTVDLEKERKEMTMMTMTWTDQVGKLCFAAIKNDLKE